MIFILAACLAALPLVARETADDEENPYFLLAGEAAKDIEEGDYAAAEKRIKEAIAMRPDDPGNVLLMSNLGMVYSYMGKDSLALATFDDALRIAPSMKTVIVNRARVLLKNGRDAEAYSDLSDVIAADSANVEARYLHGLLSLGLADLALAEADMRVLADAEPESLRTAVGMSALLSAQGKHKEATPYLKRMVEKSGEAEDYAALAVNLLELGKLSEAGETIAEGMKKYPSSGELYLCRARLNRERYAYGDAKADARRAEALGVERSRIRGLGL